MNASPPPRPEGGGEGEPAGGPRAFAVGYKPHGGDLMVYGGGAMTVVGVLATVVNGQPGFLLASIVGSLSALYFQPTMDLKSPQLGANRSGLYVARVGFIPWSEITEIHVEHRALRTMRLATLVVGTARPLKEAVSEPDRVPPMRRLMSRNARVSGGKLRVPLHTLAMNPDVIEARLRELHGLPEA